MDAPCGRGPSLQHDVLLADRGPQQRRHHGRTRVVVHDDGGATATAVRTANPDRVGVAVRRDVVVEWVDGELRRHGHGHRQQQLRRVHLRALGLEPIATGLGGVRQRDAESQPGRERVDRVARHVGGRHSGRPLHRDVLDGRSNSGLAGSASVSEWVAPNLSVTVSASTAKNGNGKGTSSVTIAVGVMIGPARGAWRQRYCHREDPQGGTTALTATTSAAGTASVSYSLKPKDPSGKYEIKADATKGGITGSNTTAFSVP